ncbi:MAG: hypothetical protein DLM68_16010, partial [Hyphomicrobiales bacterium]
VFFEMPFNGLHLLIGANATLGLLSRHSPYVDGPSLQGVLQCSDQIACVHMSGLRVRSHMNAGQDGFRDKSSKQMGDLIEGHWRMRSIFSSWIDRSPHLLVASQVLALAQHGCR